MRVVIIGGGLTGLVAGERLASRGLDAPVLEREPEPGGACRSLARSGYVFDHTGHLLHVGRPETESYLAELGVWDELVVWERRAAIVVGGHVTPYPIQIHTHGLAPAVRRDCLLGFIRAWADAADDKPESFREWVLERFGVGLAEHFFFPYNRKLYRAEPEELALDWVGRYVPKPDLEQVVDGAFGLHNSRVGYNAVFRYPEVGGIRLLPDRVASRVPGLRTSTEVVRLSLAGRWIETAAGERLDFDVVVATISLPALLDMVVDELPGEVASARRALRWVRVLNIALGARGPAPVTEHWRYFPDPALPYYRVGFPSNHGQLAPDGCHTVSVEVSLDPGGGDVEATAVASEAALAAAGLVDPATVEVRQLTMVDPAYVVHDHPRRHAVAVLRRYLGEHGVRLAGRWAEWKYSAMEDAILDGMAAARRIFEPETAGP
jgi:protoporphyrinogen oxidase